MSPLLAMSDALAEDAVIDDAEFDFDLRVTESTARVAGPSCDTDDGCGASCATSACTTFSNDPY
ncbi:MAG TPA: FxLD family lanthipeptide [Pseudonocardiaceae bacterium]